MTLQEILRRFLRNSAMILGSRLTFGLLNLATNALVVRFFGLPALGIVLLLQVYVRLFTDIIKFDSWQAILSFGTKLQEDGEEGRLRSLLGFTLGVDLAAVVMGIACAIIFTPVAADIFEWPKEVTEFAPFFALSVLFIVQGTPSGVMRLVDRVDVLALQFALNATTRFSGVVLVLLFGGGVLEVVLAWFAANIVNGLVPMIFAYRELYRRGWLPVFDIAWTKADKSFHRIWRFLLFSNLSSSLSFIYFSGTVAFSGAFLGPAAAATLQIAQQFAIAISRPARILGPLISPEFARLAANKDWVTFRSLIKRQLSISAGLIVVLSVVLFIGLGFIVEVVYGAALVEHIWLFQVMILASLLVMITFSFEPAVLSINKPNLLLALRSGAAAIYIVVSAILLTQQGIYTFAYAFLVSQIAYVTVFSILGNRILTRRINGG